MRVEPKALVRRLTPTATRYLEMAAGKAVGAQHYEIDVEHMLLSMLSDAEGECAALLKQLGQNRDRWQTEVERALARAARRQSEAPRGRHQLVSMDGRRVADRFGRVRRGAPAQRRAAVPGADRHRALRRRRARRHRADRNRRAQTSAASRAPARSAESVEAQPNWDGAGRRAGGRARVARRPGEGALARFTHRLHAARARRRASIRSSAASARSGRSSTSSRAAGRTTRSSSATPASARRRSSRASRSRIVDRTRCPPLLKNVEILGLDLGLLQAGASVKGEFENRLKGVIAEVKGSPKPIILFIDEAHTIIGAGGAAGRRRRGQPAQAGARARRAAHDRGDHLERVQEVLREGRRARAPLPARQGRRAERGRRRHDAPRPAPQVRGGARASSSATRP